MLPFLFRQLYFRRNELTWILKCNWLYNFFVLFYLMNKLRNPKEIYIFFFILLEILSLIDWHESQFWTKWVFRGCALKSLKSICVTIAHYLTWYFGYFLGYLLGSIQGFLPAAAWKTLVSTNHTNVNIQRYRW